MNDLGYYAGDQRRKDERCPVRFPDILYGGLLHDTGGIGTQQVPDDQPQDNATERGKIAFHGGIADGFTGGEPIDPHNGQLGFLALHIAADQVQQNKPGDQDSHAAQNQNHHVQKTGPRNRA